MSGDWSDVHKNTYARSDWVNKPNIFAETAIAYFPRSGRILELGAGQGQDSRFFAEHGYEVVSTDKEQTALDLSKEKLPPELTNKVTLQQLDLKQKFPFEDESFDVVYAHLSLHYFDAETTEQIFREVYRVLKLGGVFAFFTNSTTDPEHGTGEELEPDYFMIDGMAKRYFSVETARRVGQDFDIVLCDDRGETYKDSAKGVHDLIRFIGRKPE